MPRLTEVFLCQMHTTTLKIPILHAIKNSDWQIGYLDLRIKLTNIVFDRLDRKVVKYTQFVKENNKVKNLFALWSLMLSTNFTPGDRFTGIVL